ncbi:RNA-directed DNA polymerase, eukaryota, partial [Tanacetum coccineum]
ILQPGKALIYSQNLNEIKCVLKSSLNGRLVDVKAGWPTFRGFGKGRAIDGSLLQVEILGISILFLSSFHKISDEAYVNTKITTCKRKSKVNKKRLVVGCNNCYSSSIPNNNFVDDLDEANAMMNIRIYLNITRNGLDLDCKKNKVRDLGAKDKPLFLGIQETKLNLMDISLVQSLWSRSNVSFVNGGSDGASGGLLTLWDVDVFVLEDQVALLNVYGPQSSVDKYALWISLENLIGSSDVIWVIFGDFNVVRCGEERAGTHFNPREAISFNDFLSHLDLLDFQLGGRRFTRFDKSGSKLRVRDLGRPMLCLFLELWVERAGTHFNPREAISFNDFLSRLDLLDFQLGGRRFTRFDKSGSKLSKIDIFLVSHNLFDSWKDASVTVLYRLFSDHCIFAQSGFQNMAHKAF